MAILFILDKFDPKPWVKALLEQDPKLDIRIWPQSGDPKEIDFALVWSYPPGELKKYPNLKCISSLGAGVDHIMRDPERPKNVPIVRVIDKLLMRDMTQYVIAVILNYTRLFDIYHQQQQNKQWLSHTPNNEITIGIMGLGQLGTDVAKKLKQLQFSVLGWSRTAKKITGVKSFYGEKQLQSFLSKANVLVNLLPLTPATKNILNHKTFQQLPKGAYVINVARGGHLVEQDLISAIDSGQIAGAWLDVFNVEPLPLDHPFWQHPKIKITPHIASVSNAKSVAEQVVENYHRVLTRKKLLHQVNAKQGY